MRSWLLTCVRYDIADREDKQCLPLSHNQHEYDVSCDGIDLTDCATPVSRKEGPEAPGAATPDVGTLLSAGGAAPHMHCH